MSPWTKRKPHDRIERCAPPAPLTPFVDSFAGRNAHIAPARFRILPTGRAELMFNFADPFLAGTAGMLDPLAPVALLGPRDTAYWQGAGPEIDWFLIQLTPLGLRRLLGVSFAECWNAAEAVPGFSGLHEAMALSLSFTERAALAVAWVGQKCGQEGAHAAYSRLTTLVREGQLRGPDAMAALLDTGARNLRQRFTAEIGIGPKRFCSLVRFNRQLTARHPLHAETHDHALAEYADESHAAREFRRFAGVTPGAYRTAKADDALVFTLSEDTPLPPATRFERRF